MATFADHYLCSLSIKSRQVCLVLKAQDSDGPKHRIATPGRVCGTYKGAPQAGGEGLPWKWVANWRLGPQGKGWPWEGQAVFPDGVEQTHLSLSFFNCFLCCTADLLIGHDLKHDSLLWVACVPGPRLSLCRQTGRIVWGQAALQGHVRNLHPSLVLSRRNVPFLMGNEL